MSFETYVILRKTGKLEKKLSNELLKKKKLKATHEHDHITKSGRKEGEKYYNLHYKKQYAL